MTQFGAGRQVIRIGTMGGNLTVTIPRRIARELGWTRRLYLYVTRTDEGHVILAPVRKDNDAPPDADPRQLSLD